ncbi:endonuclease III [Candidatus Gracilibacteria bacterium]|nr:endonuclease III [Candidatus Gracilibacteria bacterium]MCF7819495.1 endonuclease III [Candidatus Gracilibacteria bacterium]
MKKISPKVFTERLLKEYAGEICHLDWDKNRPWTLLFAVILSAQCTDKRVNMVTPHLFREFPDLESYVARPVEEIQSIIRSTGFFRSKAKALKGSAEKMLLEFKGQVPDTMEGLTSLPGVARKTANVILWNIYEKNEGFVVDTHVGRIARRTGLTNEKNPIKVEKDLMKQLPRNHWGEMSHMLVQFGRDTCKAPVPNCSECFFNDICPQKGVTRSR